MVSKSHPSFSVRRRGVLKGLGAASGVAAASFADATHAATTIGAPFAGASAITAGKGKALVETRSGMVEGYRLDEIFAFKGIPYGRTTAGSNRFAPPLPPEPWASVR